MDVKQEAIELFNHTWDLLDLPQRTAPQQIEMLHAAHTSCYLWRQVGTQANFARGEWQVSRVYSVLAMGDAALLHAQESLRICLDSGISGLDLAFGYEAVSRAYYVLGNAQGMDENKALGIAACAEISQEEDRNYALGEIRGIGA